MAELRPPPPLADSSDRAEQSGRRPYNRPTSRLARWPVIIQAAKRGFKGGHRELVRELSRALRELSGDPRRLK
jgi:hypothetical protein